MNNSANHNLHIPVLLHESIESLAVKKSGIYIDATFGYGGHSQHILNKLGNDGKLICIDQDEETIEIMSQMAATDNRIIFRHGSFTNLAIWVKELGLQNKIDGILFDLGVSSPQLDRAYRGFSFLKDGPLDMRMDRSKALHASKWLQDADKNEIIKILKEFGEEKYCKRIANAIIASRRINPILTTKELVNIIRKVYPIKGKSKIHFATRTFQAIRIFINNELTALANCLEQCINILSLEGRIVMISFHSLEDKIIKNFISEYSGKTLPKNLPMKHHVFLEYVKLQQIGRTIHPTAQEIENNSRSRSARLRIVQRVR